MTVAAAAGVAAIPEHVAAYAAALHHASGARWARVAAVLDAAGMGRYAACDIGQAATAWASAYVAPTAISLIRRRRARRRKRT